MIEEITILDEAFKNYKEVLESKNKKFLKLDEWLLKESILFKNEVSNNNKKQIRFKRGQIIGYI